MKLTENFQGWKPLNFKEMIEKVEYLKFELNNLADSLEKERNSLVRQMIIERSQELFQEIREIIYNPSLYK